MKGSLSGSNQPAMQSLLVVVLLSSILIAVIMLPGLSGSVGATTADYVDSRADGVAFVWIYNCTLVNDNLTHYYHESVGAYVDGVRLVFNGSSTEVRVLFAPYSTGLTAECQITAEQWDSVRRSLFTDGIGTMNSAAQHPVDFPHTWPVTLQMELYFNDNTILCVGYTEQDQLVNIHYGTWTGLFSSDGWPEDSSFGSTSDWLNADGYLDYGLQCLFDTITLAS